MSPKYIARTSEEFSELESSIAKLKKNFFIDGLEGSTVSKNIVHENEIIIESDIVGIKEVVRNEGADSSANIFRFNREHGYVAVEIEDKIYQIKYNQKKSS